MPPLQVNLSDNLRAAAEARAAESGRSLDEYLSELIRADAEAELDANTETKLLEGLDSGEASELPERFWNDLIKRTGGASGPPNP